MVSTTEKERDAKTKTYKERLAFFEDWVSHLPETKSEPLDEEALRRESLYAERLNHQR